MHNGVGPSLLSMNLARSDWSMAMCSISVAGGVDALHVYTISQASRTAWGMQDRSRQWHRYSYGYTELYPYQYLHGD